MSDKARIAVLGCGSWGSTIGAMLFAKGHDARLWTHDEAECRTLLDKRSPPGVPELDLPADIVATTRLDQAMDNADAAVLVTPAQAATDVCKRIARVNPALPILIIASKGIDLQTLRPLSDVVQDSLPDTTVAVISGPCIAREVAQGIPTSVVAACGDETIAGRLQRWFATNTFRVYRQHDVLGVEYAGAYKNVIAIAAGVSDGLGFGANSKSALLTRGLAEMRRFVLAMGGHDLTVSGLAGIGDLCVTCFSPFSRNRRFGEAIGKGMPAQEALRQIGETVEGAPTAEAVVRIAREKHLQVPVAEAVTKLVAREWSPMEAVRNLMLRELKEEFEP
jgi:glycerol-3-phosphate dehydrogenase (NAD(P)+)